MKSAVAIIVAGLAVLLPIILYSFSWAMDMQGRVSLLEGQFDEAERLVTNPHVTVTLMAPARRG